MQQPDLPGSSLRYPGPAGLPLDEGAFVDAHKGGQLPEADPGLFPEALEFAWCHVITHSKHVTALSHSADQLLRI